MGSWTDLRGIIPGALTSTYLLYFVFTGPFPSIGFPRASKTLPNISSPTGTSTIYPVLITISPS